MKTLFKPLIKLLKKQYIFFYYKFRHFIKWKKLNNVYLIIDDEVVSKKVFGNIVYGDYEIDENKILSETLTQNDVLLELGTGVGFNSIYAAKMNNNKVVTFEGNPRLIPLIKKNMKKNKVNFSLRNEIVISKNFNNTSSSFNVVEDFWSSSLKEPIGGKIVEKVTVPTYNINNVIRDVKPTYLVVDIEGGEEDLFENCDFLKWSSIEKILLEMHADVIGEEQCFAVIKNIVQCGYKIRFDGAPKNVMYFFK